MKHLNFIINYRTLIILTAIFFLPACVKGVFDRSLPSSQETQSEIWGTDANQSDLDRFLKSQLLKDFTLGKDVDPQDIISNISGRLMMAIKNIDEKTRQNPVFFKGQNLVLPTVISSLRSVFVPQVKIEGQGELRIYKPAISQGERNYFIPEIAVIPLLTRLVTKTIRQQAARDSTLKTLLYATSIQSGPIKTLIFKFLQKEYPFMDPSGRIDNVYMIAEFHAQVLTSLYIDDMNDYRALLAIKDLKQRMPNLQRIVTNATILRELAPTVNLFESQTPGYFPDITLILTDSRDDVSELEKIIGKYPLFARHLKGLGFTESIKNFSSLKKIMTLHAAHERSLEINSDTLRHTDLEALKSLNAPIILRPHQLIQGFYELLSRNPSLQLSSCLNFPSELRSQINAFVNLVSGLSLRGVSLKLTMETDSLLTMAMRY